MPPQTAPAAGLSRPHDVRQRVVRGQAVGFPRCPIQRVGVRLRATGRLRAGNVARSCRVSIRAGSADVRAHTVAMARHLGFREGRGPDSAGHTRSCPPQPAPATGLGGPHDVRKGIIRGQGIGAARCTGKHMCVGLRPTGWRGHLSINNKSPGLPTWVSRTGTRVSIRV